MTFLAKKVVESVPTNPIHIDEFLEIKKDLREEIKAGFKVFMKGRNYQYSFQDFEDELENYFKRTI